MSGCTLDSDSPSLPESAAATAPGSVPDNPIPMTITGNLNWVALRMRSRGKVTAPAAIS
ncbi:MAG: hypothetical protein LBP20_03155 [Treponema sp.]|nr:hypothetical protein [Treponema sp.]